MIISIPFPECPLSARVWAHSSDRLKAYIFYLHGGGLIFSTRDDLPQPYLSMFQNAGYSFVSMDYPLAPESGLRTIREAVHTSVTFLLQFFMENDPEWNGKYILFGRSAGAYLALKETEQLIALSSGRRHGASEASGLSGCLPAEPGTVLPAAVLSYYGYHRFDLPEFTKPSPAFLKYAPVAESTVKKLTGTVPRTDGPLTERYSLYVYARQHGLWPSMACASEEDAVNEEALRSFPPVFLTAGTADEDVPFRESKALSRMIPVNRFIPVYYANHDFDRDISKKEGVTVCGEALSWLNGLL